MNLENYPDFHEKGPARCSSPEVNPDIFFTDPKEENYRKDTAKAKGYCQTCVYKTECLAWALEENEIGVWGGTSDVDRRRMKRENKSRPYSTYDNLYSL